MRKQLIYNNNCNELLAGFKIKKKQLIIKRKLRKMYL